MKRLITAPLLFLAACATPIAPAAQVDQLEQPASVISVMVLGSYHFAGSTSDLINVEPDNVLSPQRQNELKHLAKALAEFAPTAIVTERVTEAPDYRDPIFAEFDDQMLAETPNERVQIAYRLARQANIDRVYGIDEQSGEGEPDYFPFGTLMEHAAQSGQTEAIQTMLGDAEEFAQTEMARLQDLTISRALYEVNTGPLSSPEFYYALLPLDQGESQPAAELNAYWFMRNAKIFSKLEDVSQAGDRIVMVYGAGHKFWLEHLIENTPGYVIVSPEPYLLAAE